MPPQALSPAFSFAHRRLLLAFALVLIGLTATPAAHAWSEDQSAKAWARRKPKAGVGESSLKYRPLLPAKTHKHDVNTATSFHARVYHPRSSGYRAPKPRSESRRRR